MSLSTLSGLLSTSFVLTHTLADTVELPSSCLNLEDGLHYLQPFSADEYASLSAEPNPYTLISESSPIVAAQCSSGYAVIDPNFDSNWEYLFSSFHSYHTTYSGPDLNDHVTWQEWFLPSRADSEMTFTVSEDCNTCLDASTQDYGDETVYYMTGDSIGCNWATKNLCDFDSETLECFQCTATGGTATGGNEMYGKCGHMPMSSDSEVVTEHSQCTEEIGATLPSIGMTSKYCVCYKPGEDMGTNTAEEDVYQDHFDEMNKEDEDETTPQTYHLTNKDFEQGTYRITKPGTYIIDEDIEFDFNAGDLDDPNAQGAWFPTADQQDDYPGAAQDDGWYWLGFYAGMTVEADDVTIDLNGHELKMSPAFYIQQRWFVVIELSTKTFLDGQGPTFTGTGIQFWKNTVIKDGVIGLSSHLGIHGSNVTDVTIENVHIKDFETHGLGINEFNGLTIKNVEVGPSVNGQLGLNGNYNMARITLPFFWKAVEEAELQGMADTIEFKGRGSRVYTFRELVEELQDQMDLMFRWAYFGEEGEGEQWEAAYELFANPTGISRAGVVYGMLLRSRGASVFDWGFYSGGTSSGLVMENIKIHDLTLGTDEVVAFGTTWNTWVRDTFNAPVPFEPVTSNNLESMEEAIYLGNARTDVTVALRKLSQDWWYLGRMAMPDNVVEWAESGKPWDKVGTHGSTLMCDFDHLGHVPKGVVGLRIENMEDVEINNLQIYNLMNVGKLGSDKCGAYTDGSDGGMPLQSEMTNAGYGATHTRAISMMRVTDAKIDGVYVNNVMSLNGPAHGLYFINENEVDLTDYKVRHVESGLQNKIDYSSDIMPNRANEACGLSWVSEEQMKSFDDLEATCVTGHTRCTACADTVGSSDFGACSGVVSDCDESITYQTVVGTFGVDKEGQMLFDDSEDADADVVVQQNNDGYVSIVNNEDLFSKSITAKKHRELYQSSGRAQAYMEKKKTTKYGSSLGDLAWMVLAVALVALLWRMRSNGLKAFVSGKIGYGGYSEVSGVSDNESTPVDFGYHHDENEALVQA